MSMRRSKVIFDMMSSMSTETAIFLIPTGALAKQNLRDREEGGREGGKGRERDERGMKNGGGR